MKHFRVSWRGVLCVLLVQETAGSGSATSEKNVGRLIQALSFHCMITNRSEHVKGGVLVAMCDRCGKHKQAGNNVSHSNLHTKREFRPNIQKTTMMVDGRKQRLNLCTRCLRTLAKTPRGAR